MTYSNRDKGKVIERYFATELRPYFPNIQRNAGTQAREGGCDLINTPFFSFEVKGGKAYVSKMVRDCLDQVKREARPNTLRSVLFKPDREEPYVAMPFEDFKKLVSLTPLNFSVGFAESAPASPTQQGISGNGDNHEDTDF